MIPKNGNRFLGGIIMPRENAMGLIQLRWINP
jgi:hypothetical protein